MSLLSRMPDGTFCGTSHGQPVVATCDDGIHWSATVGGMPVPGVFLTKNRAISAIATFAAAQIAQAKTEAIKSEGNGSESQT